MLVNLTYPLGEDTPPYGDNPRVEARRVSDVAQGDLATTMELRMPNHSGTHVDAPLHFAPGGRAITDLAPDELVFDAPLLVRIPKVDGELVDEGDLDRFAPALEGCDLLLVHTGWAGAVRASDPARYGRRAPGFSAAAGRYLLERTSLRAVAMDMPSAASPVAGPAQEEGLEFHRITLGAGRERDDRVLLLVEDVYLDALRDEVPRRVIVAPLWLDGADGAPATVLAEVEGSTPRTG